MVLLASGSRVTKLGAAAFYGMRNTGPLVAICSSSISRSLLRRLPSSAVGRTMRSRPTSVRFCGGRFPCDYVLPKITVPSLIMNGGQDRFCSDPKTCFLSVLKNAR
ncbi:hypothetical protein OSTOST_04264 [Ostertagia ostertagi]